MNELWIKADYPIGPFARQPIEQAVADVLAKAPWAAWQTGEVAFHYEYIDRPEGAGLLFGVQPPPVSLELTTCYIVPIRQPVPPSSLSCLHLSALSRTMASDTSSPTRPSVERSRITR